MSFIGNITDFSWGDDKLPSWECWLIPLLLWTLMFWRPWHQNISDAKIWAMINSEGPTTTLHTVLVNAADSNRQHVAVSYWTIHKFYMRLINCLHFVSHTKHNSRTNSVPGHDSSTTQWEYKVRSLCNRRTPGWCCVTARGLYDAAAGRGHVPFFFFIIIIQYFISMAHFMLKTSDIKIIYICIIIYRRGLEPHEFIEFW